MNLLHIESLITAWEIRNDEPSSKKSIIFHALCRLQMEWERFVRHVVLDSCTGLYFNASGRVYSKIISHQTSRSRVEYILKNMLPPGKQKFGPSWIDSKDTIDAIRMLKPTNELTISSNLGLTPWPIEDLRAARNFVSHQSKYAAIRLKNTPLIKSNSIVVEKILFDYTYGGQKNYVYWMNFMRNIAIRITS